MKISIPLTPSIVDASPIGTFEAIVIDFCNYADFNDAVKDGDLYIYVNVDYTTTTTGDDWNEERETVIEVTKATYHCEETRQMWTIPNHLIDTDYITENL